MINYVTVMVTGSGFERFVNICKNNGINIRDIRVYNEGYTMKFSVQDYKKVRPYRRIAGVHIKILVKGGLVIYLHKYRKRVGFLLGILIFTAAVAAFSKRVWKISLYGNEIYADTVIMECIRSEGVYYGQRIKRISCEKIKDAIQKRFDRITWVSVSFDGTELKINIKEDTNDKLIKMDNTPKNITSAVDGQIVSIVTRRGTPIVSAGDTVSTEDVLVMSKVEAMDESGQVISTEYVKADADILIKTETVYDDVVERTYDRKIYTGREKRKTGIKIGDWCINYNISDCGYENYDVVAEYADMSLYDDFYLPVTYVYYTYKEYTTQEEQYTDEEMKKLLEENFQNYIDKLEENSTQIVSNSVKINLNGKECHMSGTLTIVTKGIQYEDPVIIKQKES